MPLGWITRLTQSLVVCTRTASPGLCCIRRTRPASLATPAAPGPAAFTSFATGYVSPLASSIDDTAVLAMLILRSPFPNAVVAPISTAAPTNALTS